MSNFILGGRVQRNDNSLRVILSHVHRMLLLAIFSLSVKDPNIPYRLMRGSLLAQLLPAIPANAFAPNVLLSLLACKAGEDLLHVPVTHRSRTTGAVSRNGPYIFKIGTKCAVELLQFRFNGFASFTGRARERASTADLV